PILKTFEFGRPQLYAGLMLLELAVLSLVVAYKAPPILADSPSATKGLERVLVAPTHPYRTFPQPPPSDEVLLHQLMRPLEISAVRHQMWKTFFKYYALVLRTPFIIFGLWLGGALWWVSRRLYNNAGGYVALGL